jgi:hypothetical protein
VTTKYEIGCYGDGALGHQHTRERCAAIVRENSLDCSDERAIEKALMGEMSDDGWEEDAALIILEANVPVNGASWGWQDGDFGLWQNEEE